MLYVALDLGQSLAEHDFRGRHGYAATSAASRQVRLHPETKAALVRELIALGPTVLPLKFGDLEQFRGWPVVVDRGVPEGVAHLYLAGALQRAESLGPWPPVGAATHTPTVQPSLPDANDVLDDLVATEQKLRRESFPDPAAVDYRPKVW